jgi:hypothetical protein
MMSAGRQDGEMGDLQGEDKGVKVGLMGKLVVPDILVYKSSVSVVNCVLSRKVA